MIILSDSEGNQGTNATQQTPQGRNHYRNIVSQPQGNMNIVDDLCLQAMRNVCVEPLLAKRAENTIAKPLSAGCIPALILLAAVFIDRWRRKRRGERQPLSEKLLRPAGYSLQRKLEDLNDSFMAWFMGACFLSLPAIGVFAVTPRDAIGRIFFLLLFGLAAAGCAVMAWRKLKQIRDSPSRAGGRTGQWRSNCSLCSLPAIKFFTTSPAVANGTLTTWPVGPAGVFAIETKYRTKKPGRNGGRGSRGGV